jgi:hypothetical protein
MNQDFNFTIVDFQRNISNLTVKFIYVLISVLSLSNANKDSICDLWNNDLDLSKLPFSRGWALVILLRAQFSWVSYFYFSDIYSMRPIFNFCFRYTSTINLSNYYTHLMLMRRKQFYYHDNFLINILILC